MKLKKIAALTALALAPGVSFATVGYFAHGYGMKSIGMGGVGIALPQDALAAASNPAGMAWIGNRYDIGLNWFRPDRETVVTNAGPSSGTYDANGDADFFIPEFGYNRMLNPDLAVGVSVFGNGGMNTNYANNPFTALGLGGSGPAGVDLSQLFVAPTLAYKLNEQNSVGVALNLAYQRFKAEGLQGLGINNPGYDSSTGWGVRLGWTGEVAPGLTLGATWQSKTEMSEFDKYAGLFAERGDFDIPENYGLGLAFKPTPQFTVAADVMEIKYGSVKSIANTGSTFGVNALGADNGPGFGWKDMTVYKLGIAYALDGKVTLRAGYATGSQPIPANEVFFNMLAPGVVEDHLTLGATFTLEDKAEITVGYMHAFENSVTGPIGGGAQAELKMSQDSLGIAYARQFK